MRALSEGGFYVIGMASASGAEGEASLKRLQDLLRDGGARLDASVRCPHEHGDSCGCWGTHPGFLQAAALRLDLRLNECFLITDNPQDVGLAYRAGCRPLLLLNGRTVGDLFDGHQPEPPDFPVSVDVASAAAYVVCEDEANRRWGHARPIMPPSETDAATAEPMEFAPELRLMTPVPGLKGAILAGFPQLTGMPQWGKQARQLLALYIFGGVWLSLGIAYLLTHLYRVQRFPAFVWYLTLQFIPRPLRGLLFIVTGLVVVAMALRSLLQLLPINGKGGSRPKGPHSSGSTKTL